MWHKCEWKRLQLTPSLLMNLRHVHFLFVKKITQISRGSQSCDYFHINVNKINPWPNHSPSKPENMFVLYLCRIESKIFIKIHVFEIGFVFFFFPHAIRLQCQQVNNSKWSILKTGNFKLLSHSLRYKPKKYRNNFRIESVNWKWNKGLN